MIVSPNAGLIHPAFRQTGSPLATILDKIETNYSPCAMVPDRRGMIPVSAAPSAREKSLYLAFI
jgi:hypothetical protein